MGERERRINATNLAYGTRIFIFTTPTILISTRLCQRRGVYLELAERKRGATATRATDIVLAVKRAISRRVSGASRRYAEVISALPTVALVI